MNSEMSDFLTDFRLHFNEIRGYPLVLYGIGDKTRWIIENLEDYNIIGLMDRDTTGQIIYGKKVLSPEEVIRQAKAVIIVANMSSNKIIYKRIRYLEESYTIPVFFTDGSQIKREDISGIDALNYDCDDSYILSLIRRADAISFDLFDTLVMRKILFPSYVFDIVQQQLKSQLPVDCEFKVIRLEAERYAYQMDPDYSLDHIYARLKTILNLPWETINNIKNMEIASEVNLSMPRFRVREWYNYANSLGKKVCITSDTYFDRESVVSILNECNIPIPGHLFLSCELKRSKAAGSIWDHLKKTLPGDVILHIGDDEARDFDTPRKNGIDSFLIKSSYDLLNLSISQIFPTIKSKDDIKILGLIISRYFQDPFALNETKGKFLFKSMFDVGYICFGPLIFAYTTWLIGQLRGVKIGKVLFFARDGYLLKQLYELLSDNLALIVPKGIYLYTSRRSASVISIRKKEDIALIIRTMCRYRKNTLRDTLVHAFGIESHVSDPFLNTYYYELDEESLISYIVENYGDEILSNATEERLLYQHYLSSLAVNDGEPFYCVNFVGRGATQYFLSQIIENEISGYYFAVNKSQMDSFFNEIHTKTLYDTYAGDLSGSNLMRNYLFGEIILTSPEEQFIRFNKDGKPLFNQTGKICGFSAIDECHDGVRQFFKDCLSIVDGLSMSISVELIDALYGLFLSDQCIISEKVRSSFIFRDYYDSATRNGCILEI